MARDPGSLWSPLLENGRQGVYTKTQFIVHSTGDRGTAAAIFNYFNRAEVVVESTFVVGRGPEDPTRQLLDSTSGADANLGANRRAICVEVVGAEGDDYTEWQVSEVVRIGRWAAANHPIELRICPAHDASGYGWHVMFGSPGPWTPAAKVCPGPVRIKRLRERIFPAIFNGTVLEDDMPSAQDIAKAIIEETQVGAVDGPAGKIGPSSVAGFLQHAASQATWAHVTAAGLSAAVSTLAEAVASGRDDLTAEELRAVIREETEAAMAKTVDVQVTVHDGSQN